MVVMSNYDIIDDTDDSDVKNSKSIDDNASDIVNHRGRWCWYSRQLYCFNVDNPLQLIWYQHCIPLKKIFRYLRAPKLPITSPWIRLHPAVVTGKLYIENLQRSMNSWILNAFPSLPSLLPWASVGKECVKVRPLVSLFRDWKKGVWAPVYWGHSARPFVRRNGKWVQRHGVCVCVYILNLLCVYFFIRYKRRRMHSDEASKWIWCVRGIQEEVWVHITRNVWWQFSTNDA